MAGRRRPEDEAIAGRQPNDLWCQLVLERCGELPRVSLQVVLTLDQRTSSRSAPGCRLWLTPATQNRVPNRIVNE